MKKKIYLSTIAVLLAGMTLTSCDDFLEAENRTAGGQTADDYFGQDASTYLVATYNSLKSIVYNPALYCQGTDLYIMTRGKAAGEFNEYTMTDENSTVTNYYSNVYKTINYANGVISYGAEGTTVTDEARFLRAYGYYLLTQQFGAVPYITRYINDPETNYPRTPLTEIYPALIAELTDLYNNSSLAAQDHTGRASKQAVAALLAKVYLAAGWDLDTPANDIAKGTYSVNSTANFTEAAAWAEKAINGILLTMSFADKWSPSNEGNAEEIFSVQYDRAGYPGDASDAGHSMQNNFGGYYGACTTTGEKNVSSEDAQSQKSMYLFEKGDKRYDATYMTTMWNGTMESATTAKWGSEGYYAYYNVDDPGKNLIIAHRYFPFYVTEAEAEAEFAANKKLYANPTVDGSLKYITQVTADILTLPNVIHYTFKADGSVDKKTTQAIATYNVQTSNGVCVKKFDDPESAQLTGSNCFRDIVLFHVSDMYLIAAEAYLMAGQTAQALAKVNAVRQRAGLAALSSFDDYIQNHVNYGTTSSFTFNNLDVILDERARELYAEGHRWMDLRRTKQLVRYNVEFNEYVTTPAKMMDVAGTAYKLYRPIPANEISANTGISNADQNPGYGAPVSTTDAE